MPREFDVTFSWEELSARADFNQQPPVLLKSLKAPAAYPDGKFSYGSLLVKKISENIESQPVFSVSDSFKLCADNLRRRCYVKCKGHKKDSPVTYKIEELKLNHPLTFHVRVVCDACLGILPDQNIIIEEIPIANGPTANVQVQPHHPNTRASFFESVGKKISDLLMALSKECEGRPDWIKHLDGIKENLGLQCSNSITDSINELVALNPDQNIEEANQDPAMPNDQIQHQDQGMNPNPNQVPENRNANNGQMIRVQDYPPPLEPIQPPIIIPRTEAPNIMNTRSRTNLLDAIMSEQARRVAFGTRKPKTKKK